MVDSWPECLSPVVFEADFGGLAVGATGVVFRRVNDVRDSKRMPPSDTVQVASRYYKAVMMEVVK